MDINVEIEKPEGSQRILIPFDVPQALFDNGAAELYASKLCGWTPKVIVNEIEVDNPISALQAAATRIRGIVKEEQRALVAQETAEQARIAALHNFDALFGG